MRARQHTGRLKIAITGGTGYVGRFIVDAARAAGHEVTILGRRPWPCDSASLRHIRWSLGEAPDLAGHDVLIHAAFKHQAGLYRGGEGDDPTGFRHDNVNGTIKLFHAAATAGLRSCLFLSSRAVFDGYPPGTLLTEDLSPRPTSLYGQVKVEAEQSLATMAGPRFRTITLRSTGVYGPFRAGEPHKWADLFDAFFAGQAVPARIGTEVHGADLARAALLLLDVLEIEHLSSGESALLQDGAVPLLSPSSAPDLSTGLRPNSPTGPIRANARGEHPGAEGVPELPIGNLDLASQSVLPIRGDTARVARGTVGGQSSNANRGSLPAHTCEHVDASPPTRSRGPWSGGDLCPQQRKPTAWHRDIHVSDLVLDRCELLRRACRTLPQLARTCMPLPHRQDPHPIRILDCHSLAELGWRGGGYPVLDAVIATYGGNGQTSSLLSSR